MSLKAYHRYLLPDIQRVHWKIQSVSDQGKPEPSLLKPVSSLRGGAETELKLENRPSSRGKKRAIRCCVSKKHPLDYTPTCDTALTDITVSTLTVWYATFESWTFNALKGFFTLVP